MKYVVLLIFFAFFSASLSAVDPDIFDGSQFPVPEIEDQSQLTSAFERLIASRAEELNDLNSADSAAGNDSFTGSEKEEKLAQSEEGPGVAQQKTAPPRSPPRHIRVEDGQVIIGDPNLRIERDESALGATLGDPIQRQTQSGGVAGSGPDRSRTPRGAASGSDLPTDL